MSLHILDVMVGMCRFSLREEKLDDDCGHYAMKKSELVIDEKMQRDMKRQTACHEVAHLFLRSALANDHGEGNAEALGDLLYKFIVENEPFFNWIRNNK